MIYRLSISFVCFFFFAQAKSQVLSQDLDVLSKDPFWLGLGHYHSSILGSQSKSEIRSDEFFLAKDGKRNPRSELEATILALRAPLSGEAESHAQCRFPARFRWLKSKLGWTDKDYPQVKCINYNQFSFNDQAESVSLIFATGYLSNPASFFGHPLIKFNLPRSVAPSHLLDMSVNYGAVTPPNENAFIYAMKGLFGGYWATFTHRHFYYSNHMYAEIELRDFWDYKLNFSKEEVDLFVAHSWELVGKKFDYLFLSENCATAMGSMVELITGVRLIPKSLPYSLPFTVFESLVTKKRADGSPIVTDIKLHPSRQTRLTARFNTLNEEQKSAVLSVAKSEKLNSDYKNLPAQDRGLASETLLEYFSYRSAQKRKTDDYPDLRRELLVDRLELPAASSPKFTYSELRPPNDGQRLFLTRAGWTNSLVHGNLLELRFRPAYYDFLALDHGRPQNSSVRVFDFAFNATVNEKDEKFWLKRFDILAIDTLNVSQTGLPGDGGWAWRFRTGLDSLNLSCTKCLALNLEGGFGKAFIPFQNQVFYVMLNQAGRTSVEGSGHFPVMPNVGALINFLKSGFWRAEFFLGYQRFLDDKDDDGELIVRIENRLGLSRSWDVRLTYEKHVDEQWGLAYSRYW